MKQSIKIVAVLAISSMLLMLPLGGCSPKEPVPSTAPVSSTPTASLQQSSMSSAPSTDSPVSGQGALYIGLPGGQKEVPYTGELTPDALIAALAEETGWDLTLAKPVSLEGEPAISTVALAAGSGIYSAPPEPQKDAYRVFEVQDWVYSVLNSISDTLCNNLELAGVQFTSPDGGNLDFENGGVPFFVASGFLWDYNYAMVSATPLPEGSVGAIMFTPDAAYGELPGGVDVLILTCFQPDVTAGTGTATVLDEDGNVFETVDIADPAHAVFVPTAQEMLDMNNFRAGTDIQLHLSNMLQPGETYSVTLDAGALVRGANKSNPIKEGMWNIRCANYGITSCSLPSGGTKTGKVGQPFTMQVKLTGSGASIQILGENCDISPLRLSEDGTITITPKAPGELLLDVVYDTADGMLYSGYESVNVTE